MDKLFVIKVGGNIIDDEENLKSFLQSFASVQSHKVLVHGGGKIATEIGNNLVSNQNILTADELLMMQRLIW